MFIPLFFIVQSTLSSSNYFYVFHGLSAYTLSFNNHISFDFLLPFQHYTFLQSPSQPCSGLSRNASPHTWLRERLTSSRLGKIFRQLITLLHLSCCLFQLIFLWSLFSWKGLDYEGYKYPLSGELAGWSICVMSMICIPLYGLWHLTRLPGTLRAVSTFTLIKIHKLVPKLAGKLSTSIND